MDQNKNIEPEPEPVNTNTNMNASQMGGEKEEPLKMKNRELNEKENKIISILKKHTRKNSNHQNKKKANKNTKKHVHFKLGQAKQRNNKGTRKKNQKTRPSEKQLKIRNRTLTPMPMSSSL